MSRVFSTGGGFMFDSDGNRVNMADLTRQIAEAQRDPQAAADAGAMFIAGGRRGAWLGLLSLWHKGAASYSKTV